MLDILKQVNPWKCDYVWKYLFQYTCDGVIVTLHFDTLLFIYIYRKVLLKDGINGFYTCLQL